MKIHIRVLAIAAAAFLSSHGSAEAKLGETKEEVTSDERYGEPVRNQAATLKESKKSADVFDRTKHQTEVTIEYDKDGKVWRISYKKKNFGAELIKELREWNGGKSKWSEAAKFGGNTYWVTEDQQVIAVYYGNPVFKLVIMNAAAKTAERNRHSLNPGRSGEESSGGGSDTAGDSAEGDDGEGEGEGEGEEEGEKPDRDPLR